MDAKNNHGGKREGAGRPSSNSRVTHDNKIVERKLRASAEQGWEVLADSYPDIMRRAVELAIGGEKAMPNITLLRTLLELMVKVSGSAATENETVTDALVKGFIEDVRSARQSNEPTVGTDSGESIQRTDGGHIPWANADQSLFGMGKGL